jgi:hypothetical protein
MDFLLTLNHFRVFFREEREGFTKGAKVFITELLAVFAPSLHLSG